MKKEKKKGNSKRIVPIVIGVLFILCIIGAIFGEDEELINSDVQNVKSAENEPTSNNDIGESVDKSEMVTEDIPQPEEPEFNSLSEIKLDELQQLYLNLDPSLSYPEAIDYIISTGMPYSEEKYNGSRTIQVAFTEGCTAQKYMKESGDYLTVNYDYPKNENSSNDELDKYTFSSCKYVPLDSYLSLTYTEVSTFISRLGAQLELDSVMTKEEQMLYYFNNK